MVVQLGSACLASCPGRPAKSWRLVCMATCLAALLAGCSGLSSSPRSPLPDDTAALEGLAANYDPQSVNICLQTLLAAQDASRNTIVQAMMAAVDPRYADFELGLFDANRYGNLGSTLATLGLTGARESFNREVLVEHTVLALQASMQARRNEVALRNREGLRRPALDYPLGVALSGIYAYFRRGTIVGALVGVTESATATAARARGLLNASVVRPQLLDQSSAVDPPLTQLSVEAAPRTSSARGLFQFLDSTWTGPVNQFGTALGVAAGDRDDIRAQCLVGAKLLQVNGASLQTKLAYRPAPGQCYAGYFLGVAAAAALIRNDPQEPAGAALRRFYASTPAAGEPAWLGQEPDGVAWCGALASFCLGVTSQLARGAGSARGWLGRVRRRPAGAKGRLHRGPAAAGPAVERACRAVARDGLRPSAAAWRQPGRPRVSGELSLAEAARLLLAVPVRAGVTKPLHKVNKTVLDRN